MHGDCGRFDDKSRVHRIEKARRELGVIASAGHLLYL